MKNSPTLLYKDNDACIAQTKHGYIGNRTKHISPKFLYTHEFQKNSDVEVCQIQSTTLLIY